MGLKKKAPISVYVHWPFCQSKCPYCDFNSHVLDSQIDYNKWLDAYKKEIDYYKNLLQGRQLQTIFFGGGTPSLAPYWIIEGIINYLQKKAGSIAQDLEITVEVNPNSADRENFHSLKSAGVNRISIGVQSLNDKDLKFLGRNHSSKDVIAALDLAHIFDQYSFDLIYALPWHDLAEWEANLKFALQFAKNHVSLYQLTIEKGTKFFHQHKSGEFCLPGDELAADLYSLTNEIAQNHALFPYEISNYATSIPYQCRHNLAYWEYKDYLGIGPGAHSRYCGDESCRQLLVKNATVNIHSPKNWIEQITNYGNGLQKQFTLTEKEAIEEYIMAGLRLYKGANLEHCDATLTPSFWAKVNSLCSDEFLVQDGRRIRATQSGILLLNSITEALLCNL